MGLAHILQTILNRHCSPVSCKAGAQGMSFDTKLRYRYTADKLFQVYDTCKLIWTLISMCTALRHILTAGRNV
jgi:hypothetical protein